MAEEENTEAEDLSMEIIANSGAARSAAEEGLAAAKKGDYQLAHQKLEEANKALNVAHSFHSKLLKKGASGEIPTESVLMAHAQDHVMTSMLAVDLISELVALYEVKKDK
jgi:PTS system cellobiose-specific IIA component